MGQSLSLKSRRTSLQDDTMRIGFLDFVTKPPLKIPQEYRVKSPPLGRGPYGELREAFHVTLKQRRLIKILYKTQYTEEELDKVKDEYKILQKLDHPSILKIYQNSQDDRYIYVIMEFFKGRELFDKLKSEGPIKDERIAPKILLEILHVLKYIHSKNIVYRDLKLENLLLDENGYVVLTDFGLAKFITADSRAHTFCGTPEYLAPEVILGKGHNRPADWWALGILIFEMIYGIPPFYTQNHNDMYKRIVRESFAFRPGIVLSDHGKDLITRLLVKDQAKRVGSQQTRSRSSATPGSPISISPSCSSGSSRRPSCPMWRTGSGRRTSTRTLLTRRSGSPISAPSRSTSGSSRTFRRSSRP